MLLRSVKERCGEQIRATSGVRIAVSEEPGKCPLCGGPWRVQKTVFRHGKAIELGQFEVRETVYVYANGCRYGTGALVIRRAVSLAKRIMPSRVVGYDVMVRVGILRYCRHRQREEIREVLAREGVSLSSGEVSNLSLLFLDYLQALHDARLCGRLEDEKVSRALERLQRILDPTACDVPFSSVVRRLRTRAGLFDELRDALRLAPKPESDETSPEKEAANMRDIRKQVYQLTESLEARRPDRGPAEDTRHAIDTMRGHILKHGEYLWGHEIDLPEEVGGGLRLVDRTNNILRASSME